jgi:hypothetical protein
MHKMWLSCALVFQHLFNKSSNADTSYAIASNRVQLRFKNFCSSHGSCISNSDSLVPSSSTLSGHLFLDQPRFLLPVVVYSYVNLEMKYHSPFNKRCFRLNLCAFKNYQNWYYFSNMNRHPGMHGLQNMFQLKSVNWFTLSTLTVASLSHVIPDRRA